MGEGDGGKTGWFSECKTWLLMCIVDMGQGWGGYFISCLPNLTEKLLFLKDSTRCQFGKPQLGVLAKYIFVSVLLCKLCIILMQLK